MIQITFPDGQLRSFEKGTTGLDIAKAISEGLARNTLAVKVNGEVQDALRPIERDASLEILTWKDREGQTTMWHSSAHLLAEAIQSMYPHAKFGIGPAIDKGFYYDIDLGEEKLGSEHFAQIEAEMKKLAKQKSMYERQEISKQDAIDYFTQKGDEYKLELIDGLKDGEITFYRQGGFTDLCRGPHIPHTGHIKAIKLLNVAGAYWRGDEKNKMLTRIYGITFPKKTELDAYLQILEEAKKRDHRKIGKELELFAFSEKVGLGLPLWLPKGTILRDELEKFLRAAQKKAGYQAVVSPHIASKKLYMTSGHYEKYGEDSFQPISTPKPDEQFLLKPMNCPHHCEMYGSKPRSYRDLPLRLAEFGTVYRYEQSGELHGLTRVRGFTQDDAHIFCTESQVKEEFKNVIDLVLYVFKSLGFEHFTAQVSLRDQENRDKYIGDDELWQRAEREIIEAAEEKKLSTKIEYGEAAFYGPKLDFMVQDALGREWQLGTIQVDYQLPQRFELTYKDKDNQKKRPVMIHRAPFGSLERFIAILLEHTAGNLPFWLAPEQYIILPVSEKFHEYAEKVQALLEENNLRGRIDFRDEKVGRKIRDAEVSKLKYMLVVGQKEQEDETISIRTKGEQNTKQCPLQDITAALV